MIMHTFTCTDIIVLIKIVLSQLGAKVGASIAKAAMEVLNALYVQVKCVDSSLATTCI